MSISDEWTDVTLAELQKLDLAGLSTAEIAARLRRSEDSVRDHLSIVRARNGAVPAPLDPEEPLEWNGPDEEGDVLPPSGRTIEDPAAWVHSDTKP